MSIKRQEILSSPFDSAAFAYDQMFEDNPITEHLRQIIWQTLLSRFPNGSHVLELNCGTGTDAIILAEHGVHVTAVDSSLKMIEIARIKAERKQLGNSISLHHLCFEDINDLGAKTFDGAFSNFGGLNCTTHLPYTIEQVANRLTHGSHFIACIINKYCLWETASFLLRGKFSNAFRRLSTNGIDATIGEMAIHTWYYTPKQFRRILFPWFEVVSVYGLSILSPPPNARSFFTKHPKLTDRLLYCDNSIRTLFPFHSIGDHFVIDAVRVNDKH
jgi:ubiquinone/menaquinone biosynthesis C-methylase UbiE